MKNIHILPTDKPSRLYIGDNLNFVFGMIQTSVRSKNDSFTNQHIYITSDSKFVRDEYITDGIEVIKATPKLVDAQGLVDRRDWNKIILTTDELYIHNDLIPKEYNLFPQYIQKIDDEFLEWFVKNPSCEEVEVQKWFDYESNPNTSYKIIIPKTTQQVINEDFAGGLEMGQIIPKEEPKQETENLKNFKKLVSDEISPALKNIIKEEQKQHLIDMMKSDEELGLYDESREIKIEDIFNDEKREGVKRVIHQHKVLKDLSLVNPAHLQMTSNGHGEFPDGYKLTEKGIQYIIEQLNKEEQKEIENDWEEILFDFIDFYPCILPHELFEWLAENYEIPKKKNGKD